VVEAIVGIAQGLGKQTIAEFVPDEDTRRLLEKSGVDHVQGYHVGRPKPLREALPPRSGNGYSTVNRTALSMTPAEMA